MVTYDERRIVSYAAHWCRKGKTLEQTIALAAKRRPPFAESEIRRAWPMACAACRNADTLQEHMERMRSCYDDDGNCIDPDVLSDLQSMRVCDLIPCAHGSHSQHAMGSGV